MIEVILIVSANDITVSYGAVHEPLDKLTYQGAGINVYVRKPKTVSLAGRSASLDHQAMLVVQAHHIPVISFRRVRGVSLGKGKRNKHSEAQGRTEKLL